VTSISTDVERSDYEELLRRGYREDFADLDSMGFLVLSGAFTCGKDESIHRYVSVAYLLFLAAVLSHFPGLYVL
jgi:hypothetical protein